MKRVKVIFATMLIAGNLVMAGCAAEAEKNENSLPLIALEQEVASETEIEVTVTKMISYTETKNNGTSLGYGYGYNLSSGSYSYGYGLVPDNGTAVRNICYVVLTDKSGNSYRFRVKAKDYALLSEGQSITIKAVTYTPQSILRSTEFFWGTSLFEFDADVTDMISETTSEGSDEN